MPKTGCFFLLSLKVNSNDLFQQQQDVFALFSFSTNMNSITTFPGHRALFLVGFFFSFAEERNQ